MTNKNKVGELESILGEEVKTNKEGVKYVKIPIRNEDPAIYTPKMDKINDLGFQVSAVRAGYGNVLTVWFEEVDE